MCRIHTLYMLLHGVCLFIHYSYIFVPGRKFEKNMRYGKKCEGAALRRCVTIHEVFSNQFHVNESQISRYLICDKNLKNF